MGNRWWLVASREVQENLRTRAFWIGIFVFPAILVLSVAVPPLLDEARSARTYAVLDPSGWLLEEIDRRISEDDRARFERVPLPGGSEEEVVDELNRHIASGDLFAYFILPEDPLGAASAESEELALAHGVSGRYLAGNLTDDGLRRWFSTLASEAVQERRLETASVDPEIARWIAQPVGFEVRRISTGGQEEEVEAQDLVRQWAPVAFVYLLWIAIFSVSQMLLTNTIEEKSHRIIEVLLSSISPLELMAGKILGIATTGLIMVGTWIAFFFLVVRFGPGLLGVELGVDLGQIASDPIYVGSFLVYFLLGYFFYATLFVGIGAVCNSLKEAQNLQTPVTLLLMVPLFTMVPVAQDPNGPLARGLSYLPPFTPFIMMNRAAGPPRSFEYLATTALLLAAIAIILWSTAKIFRIGILMTGKPPRPREILRWLRAPVGVVPAASSRTDDASAIKRPEIEGDG